MNIAQAQPVLPVIQGNLEAIEQGIALLRKLTPQQYNHRARPLVQSTIGEHMRHVLDLYHSLMAADKDSFVDYDVRRRGAAVETCQATAIAELQAIARWLGALTEQQLAATVTVSSEVTLYEKTVAQTVSCLARELIFVGSHTVHHYATISILAKSCDVDVSDAFGLAPATASFVRAVGS